MGAEMDCRRCGACCVSGLQDFPFVDINEEDVKKLSKEYQKKVEGVVRYFGLLYPVMPTKRGKDGRTRCIALRGTVMRQVCCMIYGRRPKVCKMFKPGSRDCRVTYKNMQDSLKKRGG
jgi:Fe-S-cluster containining protein